IACSQRTLPGILPKPLFSIFSMATSSRDSNLLGKRHPEDDLETKQILKKHKETSEDKVNLRCFYVQLSITCANTHTYIYIYLAVKIQEAAVLKNTLFIANLPPPTKISDIIDFFKDVVQVVHVRLFVNRRCIHLCYGLVEFASPTETNKALEKKNGEHLHDYKIFLKVAKTRRLTLLFLLLRYCIDHKVCYRDYLRRESLPIEENETPPDFVEEVLFVANLSPQTKISDIMYFFKDVGEVVSVRLIVNHEGKHVGYAFVDFASAYQAKTALEKKNGEYLHDHQIFLEVAKTAPEPPRPKYNLAEKLCYEDYLRRQNIVIEEDETVEGHNETPDFVEAVAVAKKTLSFSSLSREAEISHIINFFKDVGEVVHVRLIVDYTGKHVGDGFVEFASANEAEKALEKKNGEHLHGHKIFLDVAEKAPYPLRPEFCIDHNVWYEDYLRRESLLVEEDEAVDGLDWILDFIEEVAARKKTLFVAKISFKTKIMHIIKFFKYVGQVVGVRLIADCRGEHVGCGFVEFASVNEAEKVRALEKKNGKRLHGGKIFLDEAKLAPYPLRPNHLIVVKEKEEDEDDEDEEEDALETKPNLKEQEVPIRGGVCGKKIIFSYDD
ncbi:unnamed protein product, partial [Arabidopsis halleri]